MTFDFSDRTIPAGEMNTQTIESALLDDLIAANGTNKNAFRMSGPFRYGQEAVNKMREILGAFIAPMPLLRPSFLFTEAKGKVLTNLQSFPGQRLTHQRGRPRRVGADLRHREGCLLRHPQARGPVRTADRRGTQLGDRVLDCFAGSGTTLAVTQKMGRAWTGVELSPENIRDFIQPRLDGIIAGTDPLPLEGYKASTQPYTLSVPEYAAAA